MTPLTFSPPPYERRAALRVEALAALQKGDSIAFEQACSKGWTPLLHDSLGKNETLSFLALDLVKLAPDHRRSLPMAAIHRLFEKFPEVIWEMSWQVSKVSGKIRQLELEALWERAHPSLKKMLAPNLPAGFFSLDQSPSANQIQLLALPLSHKEEWPVDASQFNGLFQSPAWAAICAQASNPEKGAQLANSLLEIKISLCCELASQTDGGAATQAQRLRECIEQLDLAMAPIQTKAPASSAARCSAAALYCLGLDQTEPFLLVLKHLQSPEMGDRHALKAFQFKAFEESSKLISQWTRLFYQIDEAFKTTRYKALPDALRHQLANHPLPWRALAARQGSIQCLNALEQEWGPAPADISAVQKSSVFRPPAGILKQRDIHIARAKFDAQAAEINALFTRQVANSVRVISEACLPEELRAVLLRGHLETYPLAPPLAEPPRSWETPEYKRHLAKALRRAEAGQPFVLSHPVPFGWGAFALATGASAQSLLNALPTGELSRSARQIETLFKDTRWTPETKARIEQDALAFSTTANAKPPKSQARL